MRKNKGNKLAILLTAAMLVSVMPASAFAESAYTPISTEINAEQDLPVRDIGGEAEENVTVAIKKEKAEQLARQYVSIPKEYILQGVSLSTNTLADGKRHIWSMDFAKRVNGKHMGSIYVSIDANSGQLQSFSTYVNNPSAKPTYPLKVEREAAQELAIEFIKQIAPDYISQIRYNENYGVQLLPPLTGEVRHQLRYDRIVNDIPYVDNYIEIVVDSEGLLLEYSLQWDDTITFPKVGKRLTLEEANQKLREAADPQLKYIMPYSSQGKNTPMLSYDQQAIAIHAVSGEHLPAPMYSYRRQGTPSETPLSEKPLGMAPKNREITEQQAIEAVKEAFKLPANSELRNSSYHENNDEDGSTNRTEWYLNWSLMKDGKENGSASASVDGRTGTVMSYYSYNYDSPASTGVKAMTLEEAIAKAEDTVKRQLPWLTHELYVVKPDPKQYENVREGEYPTYYISFIHRVHGAAVEYDNVNVAIDSRTGEISSFDAYLSTYTYPALAPALISKDDAVKHWMDYYRTELTYRLVQQFWWNGQPLPIEKYNLMLASGELQGNEEEVELKSEAELVYRLVSRNIEEQVFLDAQTGEWRTRDKGEVTQLERPKALDVEGHWAEHQLELMVAYKALDLKDGLVRPNEAVTRGEIIKMLVLARNSGRGNYAMETLAKSASFNDVSADSAYFPYIESALEQNLIDLGDGSFNPDGKVSRDDMAELIVRALGYNALANYDHIFKASFKDSDQIENKGQTAIVVGLKIMSLSDGKFLPKKQVTRAEASVAFFRYLQTRAELQEAPLRM